ncbi:MAG: hypothetical protein CFE32_15235 [Alphaproteobacteria bacterium PA3]|nr:MAG: hypothetical protein CFE32_15235 [Alphaproteobacteria bacterium PA3]
MGQEVSSQGLRALGFEADFVAEGFEEIANGPLLVGIHICFEDLLHFLDVTLATTLRDEEVVDLCLQA